MHYRKHRSKVDNNQTEIVDALLKIPGITIALNHDDWLLGYQGKTYWIECKNPDKVSKTTGKLLESAIKNTQKDLLSTWKGHYKIIWTLDQVLEEIGIK